MSKFNKREAVKNIVSGKKGFVHGICDVEGNRTTYLFLHVDGDGDRASQWCPENELELLPPGDLPPFQDPYSVVGDGNSPGPGEPGNTTAIAA